MQSTIHTRCTKYAQEMFYGNPLFNGLLWVETQAMQVNSIEKENAPPVAQVHPHPQPLPKALIKRMRVGLSRLWDHPTGGCKFEEIIDVYALYTSDSIIWSPYTCMEYED